MFFVENDAFMGSPAQMTITISAAPKFCTQGRSECPEMSRLDPIHRGFVKVKPFRGLRWGLRGSQTSSMAQERPGLGLGMPREGKVWFRVHKTILWNTPPDLPDLPDPVRSRGNGGGNCCSEPPTTRAGARMTVVTLTPSN